MFKATEWMAMPSYLGMDRLLFEPFMHLARRAFNSSPNRWVRGLLCLLAGLARLTLCIMPIHVLLRVPSSHIILVLLVALDIFIHPFAASADAKVIDSEQSMLAVRFLRLMALSQAVMLILMVAFCLHSVRLRLWQFFL